MENKNGGHIVKLLDEAGIMYYYTDQSGKRYRAWGSGWNHRSQCAIITIHEVETCAIKAWSSPLRNIVGRWTIRLKDSHIAIPGEGKHGKTTYHRL